MSVRSLIRAMTAAGLVTTLSQTAWSLDLSQAYELAVKQDAQVRAARAAADIGRERLPQARAQLLPSVSLQSSRAHNSLDTTAPDTLGRPATSSSRYRSEGDVLSLRQPIVRPALWAQYRQAGYAVADAEAVLDVETQNLATRVAQLYFQALLSQDQLDVVLKQKEAYTTQLDAARRSLAAGVGIRTDVDDARARLDLAIAQELELRQGVESSRRELSLMLNDPVASLAAVDAARLVLAPPTPNSMDHWLQRAEDSSPELRALRARLEGAREEVSKARSGHSPTLDLSAQVSRSVSENITRINSTYEQKQVMLQLTIPLYQGGYVNSQVREALARQEQAENQLEAGRRDLSVRVLREFRGVSEGVLKVQALEQAVRSGEELVTSNKRSFDAGVRTRVDILNAEQQLATARRDRAQARYQYLMSKVRLAALVGQGAEDMISEVNAALSKP